MSLTPEDLEQIRQIVREEINGTAPVQSDIGEPLDMQSFVDQFKAEREGHGDVNGPNMRRLIVPTHILYRSEDGVTAEEDEILTDARARIEDNPSWFSAILAGGVPIIQDGTLLIRPSVNNGLPISRNKAVSDAEKYYANQLNRAYQLDNEPEGADEF